MNKIGLPILLWLIMLLALGACQAASALPTAAPLVSTAVPPTSIPATPTPAPTAVQPAPTAAPTVVSATAATTNLPPAGKVIASIPAEARPLSVAIGEGAVWLSIGSGDVLRIDPATNQVVATIHVGGGDYNYVSVGEGAVWAGMYGANMVARIEPQTNKVVATIPVGNAPEGVAVSAGAVWVANHHDGSVSRIDPATNKVTNTITGVGSVGTNGPLVLVTGAGAVWVEVPNIDALVRIDPATNAIVAKFPAYTGAVAVDSERVWYGPSAGLLSEIDPSNNQIVATVRVPVPYQDDTLNMKIGLGSSWLATDESLLRINPQTKQVIGELQLSGYSELAIGEGSVWVGTWDSQNLLRIEPAH